MRPDDQNTTAKTNLKKQAGCFFRGAITGEGRDWGVIGREDMDKNAVYCYPIRVSDCEVPQRGGIPFTWHSAAMSWSRGGRNSGRATGFT